MCRAASADGNCVAGTSRMGRKVRCAMPCDTEPDGKGNDEPAREPGTMSPASNCAARACDSARCERCARRASRRDARGRVRGARSGLRRRTRGARRMHARTCSSSGSVCPSCRLGGLSCTATSCALVYESAEAKSVTSWPRANQPFREQRHDGLDTTVAPRRNREPWRSQDTDAKRAAAPRCGFTRRRSATAVGLRECCNEGCGDTPMRTRRLTARVDS